MKNYEYPGAIHIHTAYSDGTSKIENVIIDAKKAGLKWIVITDHNSLEGLEKGYEGFHDGICVLVGQEISPPKSNHYLAMNLKENVSSELSPKEFIQKVNELGGFGFIAHPDEIKERENKYPALRWEDWSINGFQGIEIWNYMSDWVDTLSPQNKIKKFAFPDKTLQGPSKKVMQWWDSLNNKNERVVPAIAGLDVHAFKYKYFGINLTVFPYLKSFKTFKNYIQIDDFLSKDFETAKKQIYGALRDGNNLMVNETLGSLQGVVFNIYKITEKNKYIKSTVGEFLPVENEFTVVIETPAIADIKLYCDGELVQEKTSNNLKYKTNKRGSYRFEAYKNGRHWIISNPIKVIKSND